MRRCNTRAASSDTAIAEMSLAQWRHIEKYRASFLARKALTPKSPLRRCVQSLPRPKTQAATPGVIAKRYPTQTRYGEQKLLAREFPCLIDCRPKSHLGFIRDSVAKREGSSTGGVAESKFPKLKLYPWEHRKIHGTGTELRPWTPLF